MAEELSLVTRWVRDGFIIEEARGEVYLVESTGDLSKDAEHLKEKVAKIIQLWVNELPIIVQGNKGYHRRE